jgi:RNA polymerase sigma-70 factor (ECF subfamily)
MTLRGLQLTEIERSAHAMPSDDDDRTLVATFLRGDEAGFRGLYRRHSPSLFALVRRLLGPRQADAEDVLQETWLRAARGLAAFRWESSLRTWLASIAANTCRERQRANVREPTEPLGDHEPATAGAMLGFTDLDVERAVAALPSGYRAAVVLHDVWGLTHEEIGGSLGIDPGTSKSQLHRARRSLKSLLAGAPNPRPGD